MDILCHRGLWRARTEQNTLPAFASAWAEGWGIETDLRDLDGDVVVSHDPARGGAMTLDELLAEHTRRAPHTTLALNVKADGLAASVAEQLRHHATRHAFVFDMSVPDHLAWLRTPVVAYTRWSDVEPAPVLRESSAGIWLDAFHDDDWWEAEHVRAELQAGRRVAIVSPELHGRAPEGVWDRILRAGLGSHRQLALCTDVPRAWLARAATFSRIEQVAL